MNEQALYLEDPLKLEFEAHITQVIDMPNGRMGVTLDRTYFYPTGGGQWHDTGSLEGIRVVEVIKPEDKNELIHVVDVMHEADRKLEPGRVHASIDRGRRLRHMQHHTAQHLLTGCFVHLLGYETVSAHISGYTPSTIDMEAESVSVQELVQVEDLANQVITENRSIKTYFASPEEIQDIPLRKPPPAVEQVRIVEIDGFDYSACGGTHCLQTGMIGVLKILKTERQNEKLRVSFVAGEQALEYFQEYQRVAVDLAGHLSVGLSEVMEAVVRLEEGLRSAQKELSALRIERIGFEAQKLAEAAESVGKVRLVLASFRERPVDELRLLAKELKEMPDVVTLMASFDGKKVTAIAACGESSGVDARLLLNALLGKVGGRGGGEARLAQGGGAASEEEFAVLFEGVRGMI
jgi:alanyl-tRNA synthetase